MASGGKTAQSEARGGAGGGESPGTRGSPANQLGLQLHVLFDPATYRHHGWHVQVSLHCVRTVLRSFRQKSQWNWDDVNRNRRGALALSDPNRYTCSVKLCRNRLSQAMPYLYFLLFLHFQFVIICFFTFHLFLTFLYLLNLLPFLLLRKYSDTYDSAGYDSWSRRFGQNCAAKASYRITKLRESGQLRRPPPTAGLLLTLQIFLDI